MPGESAPAVVLVHGLWMGRWATFWLARRLATAGLRPYRFGYASMRGGLDANADRLAEFARGIRARELHWLGHSLGGMLIFRTLSRHPMAGGRVAMLGSPLLGSFAAARLSRWPGGRRLLGRSVRDWFAAPDREWTLPQELGIVAGTRAVGLGRLVAPDLPTPNDGVIAVEETRLPGARAHICLPVCHLGMLFSQRAADCAAGFLIHGVFPRSGTQ